MAWVVWVLFESRAALAALLGVVLFVLLVHWRRSGRPRPLLLGLAAAVLLLVVQALVVTKREHARRILSAIEQDIVASRTTALAAALAPDFDFPEGRAGFLELVDHELARIDVRYLERWWLRVERDEGERFTVVVEYSADIAGVYAGTFQSGWELTFVNTADGWRVQQIRPRHLAGMGNVNWSSIRGM